MKRRNLLVGILLAVALVGASCGTAATPQPSGAPGAGGGTSETGGTAGGNAQTGGKLLDSLLSEPDSLDPAKATLLVSSYVLAQIYDRLVYIGDDGQPHPWLADSWDVNDGGKAVVFHLHPGIKFTDGTPLDAEAVKFNFDRILDPATAAPHRGNIGPLTGVKVLGDLDVEFDFSQPFAAIWSTLDSPYFGIASPAAIQKFGEDFGRNPVGTGPFKLEQWTLGQEILLEKNPDYVQLRQDVEHTGAPYLDEISIKLVPEEGTRLAALQTGELHMAWAPFEDVEQIKADPNLQIIPRDKSISEVYLEFNENNWPFDDVNVRKAVGYAVNPEEVLAASYLYGTLIKSPMPIGTLGYSKEVGEKYGFTYDPAKAESLLKEAGWTKGSDGVYEKDGKRLEVTLETWNADQITRAAQVIQQELQKVGFSVKIQTTDAGTFLANIAKGGQQFDLDRTTSADPVFLSTQLKCPGRWKHYCSEEMDALLAKADQALDTNERMEILAQVQQLALEDAINVPLFSDTFLIAASKKVHGYRFDEVGDPIYYDVWLER